MLNKKVRGFYRNPLDHHPLSEIWIEETDDESASAPAGQESQN